METNKFIINIISLYSSGKRYDNFRQLLNYLINKDYCINVVLQEYPQPILDYLKLLPINIQIVPRKNPGSARNVFLKKYYDSNFDMFLLIDDDVNLIKQNKTKNDPIKYVLNKMEKHPDYASYTLEEDGYTYRWLKRPEIRYRLDGWGAFLIIRNFNKLNKVKVFFTESLNALEEIDFMAQIYRMKLGKTMFDRGKCSHINMLNKSTYGDNKKRKEIFKKNRIKVWESNKDIIKINKPKTKLLGLMLD